MIKNQQFNTSRWLLISFINFCLVALAGLTLRYKINFALPSINQKNLLHGHSNFAFTGWVTIALMTLMVHYLQKQNVLFKSFKYNIIIGLNCLFAYGLFISFILQGYDTISLTCTALSILTSYVFIAAYWADIKNMNEPSLAPWWFKATLVIWAISSLGAIVIGYLMLNTIFVQDWYLGAFYFFLHFQYNGWFLFACFALFFYTLYSKGRLTETKTNKKLFYVMAITVVPAFILSIMWLNLPVFFYWLGYIAGFLQLLLLVYLVSLFKQVKKRAGEKFSKTTKILWIMALIAFMLKVILQFLSIIPSLSSYAFGYRPIIIGYLHLSFLGIVSFFIIGYIHEIAPAFRKRVSPAGIFIFVAGVLAQEIILMSQGLGALEVEPLPFANIALFYCAAVMFAGLAWMAISFARTSKDIAALT